MIRNYKVLPGLLGTIIVWTISNLERFWEGLSLLIRKYWSIILGVSISRRYSFWRLRGYFSVVF